MNVFGVAHPKDKDALVYTAKYLPEELPAVKEMLLGKTVFAEHNKTRPIGKIADMYVDPEVGLVSMLRVPIRKNDAYCEQVCRDVWAGKWQGLSIGSLITEEKQLPSGRAVTGIKPIEVSICKNGAMNGAKIFMSQFYEKNKTVPTAERVFESAARLLRVNASGGSGVKSVLETVVTDEFPQLQVSEEANTTMSASNAPPALPSSPSLA